MMSGDSAVDIVGELSLGNVLRGFSNAVSHSEKICSGANCK